MRWVFDELFAAAKTRLADRLTLTRADTIGRHAWDASGTLDLFADIDRSADAIAAFAGGAEAKLYLAAHWFDANGNTARALLPFRMPRR